MKLCTSIFILLFASLAPHSFPQIEGGNIDKRYVEAFDYIVNSKTLNDLWNEYDSPFVDKIPIIVNSKIYNIDLMYFKEEILNNTACGKSIGMNLIDSLYIESLNDSSSLKYRSEFGKIENLSNIPTNSFSKTKNILVIIFSEPFRNLILAHLFHSNSMDSLDAKWIFGSGYDFLFCFDDKNQISKVFVKHIAYN